MDDASTELDDDSRIEDVKLEKAEVVDVELIGFRLDVVLWKDMEAVDET